MRSNKGAKGPLFDLHILVKAIKGRCPVFEVGNSFVISNGYILESKIPICMHALSSLLPFYSSLSRGISPEEMGLGKEKAYVQCPDPCTLTGGGTVIFEISIPKSKSHVH